jgi:phage terminase small subunit
MLTPKQQRFVEEYLKDSNATQAAVRAGYKPKHAPSIGSHLLKHKHVGEAVRLSRAGLTAQSRLTAGRVLEAIQALAFEEGIENHNRLKALELLGKHLVLFTEKTEHSGEIQLPVRVVHEYQPASLEPAIDVEVRALSPASSRVLGEGEQNP